MHQMLEAEAGSWRHMPAGEAVHLRGVQVTRPLLASWPASVLSPNNRKHWRLKSDAKRLQRCEWAYVALGMGMKAKLTDGQKLDVRLEFYPPDRKIRDADNLLASCKAGLDGLSDALGIDDSRFRISFELMDDTVRGGCVKVYVAEPA